MLRFMQKKIVKKQQSVTLDTSENTEYVKNIIMLKKSRFKLVTVKAECILDVL